MLSSVGKVGHQVLLRKQMVTNILIFFFSHLRQKCSLALFLSHSFTLSLSCSFFYFLTVSFSLSLPGQQEARYEITVMLQTRPKPSGGSKKVYYYTSMWTQYSSNS